MYQNVSRLENSSMKSDHRPFKETQIFDWDTEPKEERPSEFHTTGFSTASGYYHSMSDARPRARPRRSSRFGIAPLIVGLLAAIALGSIGVEWLAHLLRG